MKASTFITLVSSCAVTAYAETAPSSYDMIGQAQIQQQQFQPTAIHTSHSSINAQTLELSEQQLLQQPELLQQLLDSAIETQQIDGVRVLLPIYAQSSHVDKILYQYGQAVIAESDGKMTQAIDLYRQIIAHRPDLTPIRFKLVQVLIQDKQWASAEHQLQKIASEQDLPTEIKSFILSQQLWLKQQYQWSFHSKLRYLNDKNINQAPRISEHRGWKLPEAQSAQGIGYSLAGVKTYTLSDHVMFRSQISVDGKTYRKTQDYDDVTAHIGAGILYQTAHHEWLLSPFYEQRWFAREPYSHTLGIQTQYNHLFSARWRGFTQLQYAKKTHQKRHHLNAKVGQISASMRYIHTPTQAWSFGGDVQYEHTQDKSEGYQRTGLWSGWEQEWRYGLSTAIFVGINRLQYRVEDIFQIKRKEHEYFAQGSVWHRALHWKGLTPRFTTIWRKNASNHFVYDYDKTQVFFELSKTF